MHAVRASLACEIPIKPIALLGADDCSDGGDKGFREP